MQLSVDKYKSMTAAALCADPFFQEWIFHPLGMHREFFLHLLISNSPVARQLQFGQQHLLRPMRDCALMKKAIEQYTLLKGELEKEQCTQACFNIAEDYCIVLRQKVTSYSFATNEKEIHFFKYIKPLFLAEKEYYQLLHHAELFHASETTSNFWERQPGRLDRFVQEHTPVIQSYSAGIKEYDEWWYCRGEYPDKTLHDETIGSYLGMVRYLQFVQQLISKTDE